MASQTSFCMYPEADMSHISTSNAKELHCCPQLLKASPIVTLGDMGLHCHQYIYSISLFSIHYHTLHPA